MKRCTCGGRWKVYCSRTQGLRRTRYLRCRKCEQTTKQIVSVDAEGYEVEEIPTQLLRRSTNILELIPGSHTMQV